MSFPAPSRKIHAFREDRRRKLSQAVIRQIESLILHDLLRRGDATGDPKAEAALDADVHIAIIEASHIIALHLMRAMQDLLRQRMLFNDPRIFTWPTLRGRILDQHAASVAAIQARDGRRARAELEAHLDCVAEALAHQRQADEKDREARLRLRNR